MMERKPSLHEACLREKGYMVCSPVSNSMRPMLRARRNHAVFVPTTGRLKPLDVAVYVRPDGAHIVHRVLRVLPDGYWFRGDNANAGEYVPEAQILAVMQGFYRGDKYYDSCHWGYRLYSRLWVLAHPLLMIYKKGRRKLCSVFKSRI